MSKEDVKVVEKEKKNKRKDGKKSLLSRIINIVLWVIILTWMSICIVDFLKVHKEKDPIFCLSKKTIEYEDGVVYLCTGLGYKVYDYQRDSFNALEFGPFWIKDRSVEENN